MKIATSLGFRNQFIRASTLAFALALSACGGAGFSAFDDPAAGAAGAAGDVDPGAGAGGSAGAGGTPDTGGSAGSVPGGTSGAAGVGTGGTAAGSAGSSSAGSAGSGATGAGGVPAGGTGGGPSCAPEEAIVPSAVPETFNWNGFSARFDDVDQSYCASSAGATCALRNVEFMVYTDTVRVQFYLTCQPEFRSGVCGAEAPCETTIDQTVGMSSIFTIAAVDGRYRLTGGAGNASAPRLRNPGACHTELTSGSGSAAPSDDGAIDFGDDIVAMFRALEFSCP